MFPAEAMADLDSGFDGNSSFPSKLISLNIASTFGGEFPQLLGRRETFAIGRR